MKKWQSAVALPTGIIGFILLVANWPWVFVAFTAAVFIFAFACIGYELGND
jgi:hypothetical protein